MARVVDKCLDKLRAAKNATQARAFVMARSHVKNVINDTHLYGKSPLLGERNYRVVKVATATKATGFLNMPDGNRNSCAAYPVTKLQIVHVQGVSDHVTAGRDVTM